MRVRVVICLYACVCKACVIYVCGMCVNVCGVRWGGVGRGGAGCGGGSEQTALSPNSLSRGCRQDAQILNVWCPMTGEQRNNVINSGDQDSSLACTGGAPFCMSASVHKAVYCNNGGCSI